jgi:hypothetical protein
LRQQPQFGVAIATKTLLFLPPAPEIRISGWRGFRATNALLFLPPACRGRIRYQSHLDRIMGQSGMHPLEFPEMDGLSSLAAFA